MERAEIERVLAQSLAAPLSEEELRELAGRLRVQEDARLLASADSTAEEPAWPPGCEAEP